MLKNIEENATHFYDILYDFFRSVSGLLNLFKFEMAV